jgi:hypothetical protein
MSRLEVQVAHVRLVTETGTASDALQVTARNLQGRTMKLVGCAVVLPFGLRIHSDPPALAYPYELETGAQCADRFDCRVLARLAREAACEGRVEIDAMFLEAGGFDEARFARRLPSTLKTAAGVEHRSAPFVFDLDRWT